MVSQSTVCGKIYREFCPKNQPILVSQQIRWYDKYIGIIHVMITKYIIIPFRSLAENEIDNLPAVIFQKWPVMNYMYVST